MTPPPITITVAQREDEDILWVMLFFAAHMEKDGATALDAGKYHPYLQRYVASWGKPGDYGVIAFLDSHPIGAVWSRVLQDDEETPRYFDQQTPELAVAVLPGYLGQGIGTQLLNTFLIGARQRYPAVGLTVRADNPAYRLYQRLGFQTSTEIVNRVGTRSFAMVIDFRHVAGDTHG